MNYFLIFYLVFLGVFAFISFLIVKRALFLAYPGDFTKKAVMIYVIFCFLVVLISFVLLAKQGFFQMKSFQIHLPSFLHLKEF